MIFLITNKNQCLGVRMQVAPLSEYCLVCAKPWIQCPALYKTLGLILCTCNQGTTEVEAYG